MRRLLLRRSSALRARPAARLGGGPDRPLREKPAEERRQQSPRETHTHRVESPGIHRPPPVQRTLTPIARPSSVGIIVARKRPPEASLSAKVRSARTEAADVPA